jgi:Transposase DDE domain
MRDLRFATTGESNMSDTIEWSRYNSTLIERGKLTFWVPEDVDKTWYCNEDSDRTYTDRAVEVLSILRFKFGLTLRETEGFAKSIFGWMGLNLEVPSYSTLCRRLNSLSLVLWQEIQRNDQLHIVVDATGLKVYGEGEWKVRIHGCGKRRTWRKLHLAVNEANNRILGVVLTTNDFKDNEVLPVLMNQVDPKHVSRVTGDGAYDDNKCFAWAEENKVKAVFPPKRGAKIHQHGNSKKKPKIRDLLVREIRSLGRRAWKKQVEYHRRSIAETAMYRFKTLLGDHLQSRKFQNQWAEVLIKVNILNQMKTPRTCT